MRTLAASPSAAVRRTVARLLPDLGTAELAAAMLEDPEAGVRWAAPTPKTGLVQIKG